ncbi:MAG TPA: arylesterase [Opitutaceae bacterium]|nr:arylesterase [Opitutaceae bacterium]
MKLFFTLALTGLLLGFLPTGASAADTKTIVFFGDSLTAGYGLDDHTTMAFPGLIQKKIHDEGLPYTVINAGLSGDTSAGGLRRINWILRQKVDIFVLELGGNDGLRGLPVASTQANLQAIIDQVRAKNPNVKLVIAGMQMPISMGAYTQEFAAMYPALAKANQATLIPFLLKDVGGVPELNLPDGIHPTPEGHRRVSETIWPYLKPLL